jgi:3-methyladenine DNA glycosylase AlkD
MPTQLTAEQFVRRLTRLASAAQRKKYHRFFEFEDHPDSGGDRFIGVPMGRIFSLAKEFMALAPDQIEALLESPIHEVRVGAVSVMDWQARSRKTTGTRRKELFDLYLRRHDRIDSWDLVDRSAPYVVGQYLADRPRTLLDRLARSKRPMERRTAIVATGYFIRQGQVDDTFRIAERLLDDDEDLIHKAAGWMLRAAGGVDRKRLLAFLDRHAARMPRVMLRYALEHQDAKTRSRYVKRD